MHPLVCAHTVLRVGVGPSRAAPVALGSSNTHLTGRSSQAKRCSVSVLFLFSLVLYHLALGGTRMALLIIYFLWLTADFDTILYYFYVSVTVTGLKMGSR